MEQMWINDGSEQRLAEIKIAMVRMGYTPLFDKHEDGTVSVLIRRPEMSSIKLLAGQVLISDGTNISVWERISF